MRKLVLAALTAITLAAPALLQAETITGKVVSLSCYFQTQKNAGVPEDLCAYSTIKYEGNPVGLVTSDGKVYQLAGAVLGVDNAKMVPLIGKIVTVTGNVSKKAGTTMLTSEEDAKRAQ
jgi:hypothetical protein